jgi:glycosyltransferase involved in cell wall biosynthesis
MRICFHGLNLSNAEVAARFGGMYTAFFAALSRKGVEVAYSPAGSRPDGDVLVVPVGGGQDREAARAMAAVGGPTVLYVPSAQSWFRSGFLQRWADQVLFAYGTDEAPETKRRYEELGLVYHPLPFASDPAIMRPLGLEEQHDVVFVANATSGEGRHAYVASLVEELGVARVLVVGPGWERYGYPRRSIAWGPALNAVYNLGRVCVNVHNLEQWTNPISRLDANNRLFDLAMAGRPQVCVGPAIAEQYFGTGEVAVADSPQVFVDEVRRLLSNIECRREMAETSRARALSDHTWDDRARMFADWLRESWPVSEAAGCGGLRSSLWRVRDTVLPPYGPIEALQKARRRAARLTGSCTARRRS